MSPIERQPTQAARQSYDLIVIGGGIYGVTLTLMAAYQGRRVLLLERDDFGGATSYNSLRIVHGGLRYLQVLDLPRFFESVGERRWLLQHFPGRVQPLPCLMPLYGEGIRRNEVFRLALGLNDMLSARRNRGVLPSYHLPAGRILSPDAVGRLFPRVDRDGLRGGALWYDGSIPDSQRLLIDMLRLACGQGATALNYTQVEAQSLGQERVSSVTAIDHIAGQTLTFEAPVVVNTAGPWCRELAAGLDRDYPDLFHSSMAWNVLFDRPALSDHALALTPRKPDGQTYFIRPWKGGLLAGTIHEPWEGVRPHPTPTVDSIRAFMADLNGIVAGLELADHDIVHIFAGLLPAKTPGSHVLAAREVIVHHADQGGPHGLWSVSGVKLTTARLVAEKTLRRIWGKEADALSTLPTPLCPPPA